MCRLMAYMGPPVLVADVVLWPDRSILKQSYDARERKMDASLPQHLVRMSAAKEHKRNENASPDERLSPSVWLCRHMAT